jgi:hypothetical protein
MEKAVEGHHTLLDEVLAVREETARIRKKTR